ncbi:MAG: hypothetical protein H6970_06770 [Gammaproteobacteria bacterium]|nr:hypothetical protein [Gammaproteobacteria bacterium]MCP5459208.1 hypothetical protein [Gammaproteobacteria bacterium]
MRRTATLIALLSMLLALRQADAVTGVNPSGVNVRTSGTSTVFLTFQNLDPNEEAMESFFCGDLIAPLPANQVFSFNPCDPTTIFGQMPSSFNQARVSGTGGQRNLTDIMTIQASITRRAFQAAQSGQPSQFFYVRRFSSGAFVVVTCRMAGGGARSPLALLDVRVGFVNDAGDFLFDPIYPVETGGKLPSIGAYIKYNGSGRLRGRWEVMLPGETPPSEQDLLTEATLPVEQRGLQRRYTFLEHFDIFLTPVGEVFLPGPKSIPPPTRSGGLHLVLLRIEASGGRENRSNTGNGLVASTGAVAGFPMPVLRYFVGNEEQLAALQGEEADLQLLTPLSDAKLPPQPVSFSWIDSPNAEFYRLEVQDEGGAIVVETLVRPGVEQYTAPPWLTQRSSEALRWRVVSLDRNGRTLNASPWRGFQIESE